MSAPSDRTWRIVSLVLLVVGLAWSGIALGVHASADVAWHRVRDRLGHADYDAARSDALYERVYSAREHIRRGATLAGVALLLLSCAVRPRTPLPTSTSRRMWVATILDALLVLALLALLAAPARFLDLAGNEASAALLGRLSPFVALSVYAVARGPRAAPWRVLVATLALLPLAPFALLASPYVLAAPERALARTLAAPHRRVAGI